MGNHHEPFRALAPVDWADVPHDDLTPFLHDVFAEAYTVIDSIPSAASTAAPVAPSKGRARAKTDSAVTNGLIPGRAQDPAALEMARQLQQEWKEVKVNPNPLGVKVYKMGAKDGRGAWFARRSVHEGLSFEQWEAGLDREFIETMEVQGGPGSGSIRGIGADKRVEDHNVPGAGHAQVFQLSAQFPGPTSPRDFITLLLTSDFSHASPDRSQLLRQYMIVSKPCNHPECPPRQGIIRGQYESVELIREIAAENLASKRSLSSADLMTDKNMAPAVSKAGSNRGDGPPIAIEWLMVTRSDPGGSVPRFMIEKGTPPGIVNDAGKFLNWVTRNSTDDSNSQEGEGTTQEKGASSGPVSGVKTPAIAKHPADGVEPSHPGHHIHQDSNASEDGAWSSNGLYGMITGALGAATSVVSGGLLRQFGALEDHASDNSPAEEAEGETSSSDTSSIRSFASALERSLTHGKGLENDKGSDGVPGSHSEGKSQGNQPQHKELRRLEERRRKLDEKTLKMTERIEKQRQGDKEKDAASLAKVREKHEKEIAKHEAKYKRELRRIEEKREQEERKAEERKKKAAEREERSNLSLEIEKVRVERDVALKQAELLKSQVGELQAQNTMLAAKMGKLSDVERRDSGSTTSSKTRKHSQGMSPKISPG